MCSTPVDSAKQHFLWLCNRKNCILSITQEALSALIDIAVYLILYLVGAYLLVFSLCSARIQAPCWAQYQKWPEGQSTQVMYQDSSYAKVSASCICVLVASWVFSPAVWPTVH
ncbi:hypothetical protein DUNSADRAFT_1584 [Dunaliella salina]|uniref:Uncharacterized protein n=1 Tax=Dunaliella salina TaxID=3046 RepID=A0ABZ3LP09_DUNSA|nr:hypothetical protein DUNSADRAFT_1584 [Dunaliella salina]|eukprot:KAF5843157.1 hypothetical protein DUNSADRAFT_1584 [Dunaliella salina]